MSIQEYLDENNVHRSNSEARSSSTSTLSRRILVAYPGERIVFSIAVKEPVNHIIQIRAEGLPKHIASITANPDMSTAPFTSSITILVNRGTVPGNYPFNLAIYDITKDRLLGLEHMVLVILDKKVPRVFVKHYSGLIKLYRRYGAQAVIWYLLSYVFTKGATFNQLKTAYELVTQRRVSNGTIGSILKRMRKKRIIIEKTPGIYISNVKDFNILLSRIDVSRVRVQAYKAKRSRHELQAALSENTRIDFNKLPAPIRRLWKRAQEIAYKHGVLAALYFLIYSLFAVRQTGYLLYWFNMWFIYCEQKTNFCHHFYSVLLHEMLQRLGLPEGIQYNYFKPWEHLEAQRIAQEYIRKYYVSHPNARRLHYMLKKLKYIRYDNDIYTLKIYHYEDEKIGLEIYDDKGEELLHSDSVRKNLVSNKVEIKTAFPFEHVDKQNENTYSVRPAGLY